MLLTVAIYNGMSDWCDTVAQILYNAVICGPLLYTIIDNQRT